MRNGVVYSNRSNGNRAYRASLLKGNFNDNVRLKERAVNESSSCESSDDYFQDIVEHSPECPCGKLG